MSNQNHSTFLKFTFPFPKPTHVNHSFSPIQFISIVSHTRQYSFQSFKRLDTITAMHSLFLSLSSCFSYFSFLSCSCYHYIFFSPMFSIETKTITMWWLMCSIAALLEAEALSVLCCCWSALFWFCFTWWIYCFGFFRLGCNSVYWVLVFYFIF